MNNAIDNYIDQEAVGEILGVPGKTVARWRWLNDGPPVHRFGKRRRYKRSEVLEWADAQRQANSAD